MSFIETPRFPEAVSYGFTGGPEFNTDVVIVNSGAESRNANWAQPRRSYDASHAARLPAAYQPLQAFFHVVSGRLHGFRVKDWTDYRDNDAGGAGIFGVIDATHFQMYKRYTSGASTHERKIQKPVSGKVTVTGGTVDSIDYTTGIVTMTSGTPTSWAGEFDVPCRFDVDQLKGEVISRSGSELIIGWDSIPIIEIRV